MFAVIKTGGKQYKVAQDTILEVEKLDAEEGATVTFDQVLMIGGDSPAIGAPFVEGASVQAEVLAQKKGPKTIKLIKRRRKHSSQRRKGHRQNLTVVKIAEILAAGQKPAKKAAKKDTAKAAAPKAETAKKAASKADAADTEGTKPANLLDAPNGDADDLSKISGVGPALVKKLNGLGVFHFSQIAEWNAENIAYVDAHLSFKGRIERDNWIEQAKTLAEEAK